MHIALKDTAEKAVERAVILKDHSIPSHDITPQNRKERAAAFVWAATVLVLLLPAAARWWRQRTAVRYERGRRK